MCSRPVAANAFLWAGLLPPIFLDPSVSRSLPFDSPVSSLTPPRGVAARQLNRGPMRACLPRQPRFSPAREPTRLGPDAVQAALIGDLYLVAFAKTLDFVLPLSSVAVQLPPGMLGVSKLFTGLAPNANIACSVSQSGLATVVQVNEGGNAMSDQGGLVGDVLKGCREMRVSCF